MRDLVELKNPGKNNPEEVQKIQDVSNLEIEYKCETHDSLIDELDKEIALKNDSRSSSKR